MLRISCDGRFGRGIVHCTFGVLVGVATPSLVQSDRAVHECFVSFTTFYSLRFRFDGVTGFAQQLVMTCEVLGFTAHDFFHSASSRCISCDPCVCAGIDDVV